jgi:hypothetical protein
MRTIPAVTIHALASKGVRIIGFMHLPTGRGYIIAHRGIRRVVTHADLLALAKRQGRVAAR